MSKYILCPKCNNKTTMSKATGDICCLECNYIFDDVDRAKIFKDSYELQKQQDKEKKGQYDETLS